MFQAKKTVLVQSNRLDLHLTNKYKKHKNTNTANKNFTLPQSQPQLKTKCNFPKTKFFSQRIGNTTNWDWSNQIDKKYEIPINAIY